MLRGKLLEQANLVKYADKHKAELLDIGSASSDPSSSSSSVPRRGPSYWSKFYNFYTSYYSVILVNSDLFYTFMFAYYVISHNALNRLNFGFFTLLLAMLALFLWFLMELYAGNSNSHLLFLCFSNALQLIYQL